MTVANSNTITRMHRPVLDAMILNGNPMGRRSICNIYVPRMANVTLNMTVHSNDNSFNVCLALNAECCDVLRDVGVNSN